MQFLFQQLQPTYSRIGHKYITVKYIPYGLATETKEKFIWTFTCQNGPNECLGNRAHACVIELTAYLKLIWVNFLSCYAFEFEAGDPSTFDVAKATSYCCSEFGIDFKIVWDCATGALGDELMHKSALNTQSLTPNITSTPWIVVNGIHNTTMQNQAVTDLESLICSLFPASELPPACVP